MRLIIGNVTWLALRWAREPRLKILFLEITTLWYSLNFITYMNSLLIDPAQSAWNQLLAIIDIFWYGVKTTPSKSEAPSEPWSKQVRLYAGLYVCPRWRFHIPNCLIEKVQRKGRYRAIQPFCREVLKMMFWEIQLSDWLVLQLPTAQAGPRNLHRKT